MSLYCPRCRVEFDGDIYCPSCRGIVDCVTKCSTPSCRVAIHGGSGSAYDDFNQPAVQIGTMVYCSRCAASRAQDAAKPSGDQIQPGAVSVPAEMIGEWYSPEYGYAFQLSGNQGTLTALNDPKQQVGDVCIRIAWVQGNKLKGEHGFVDGTWHQIEGEFLSPNQLRLRGRGLEWVLEKK